MAFQTKHIRRFQQIGVVLGPVNVMATETSYPARIHYALDKVVSLHPVLVRSAIGKMRERLLAQLVVFELPVVFQVEPGAESHRPVVIAAIDRIVERLPLRMALNAKIRRLDRVEARRVYDV